MIQGFNKAIIIGVVTSKLEIRMTSKNINVCNFKISTSHIRPDGSTKIETHNIEVWDKLANKCNNILPDSILYIEGRLETEMWGDKKNHKQKTKIVANTLDIISNKIEQKNIKDGIYNNIEDAFDVISS